MADLSLALMKVSSCFNPTVAKFLLKGDHLILSIIVAFFKFKASWDDCYDLVLYK